MADRKRYNATFPAKSSHVSLSRTKKQMEQHVLTIEWELRKLTEAETKLEKEKEYIATNIEHKVTQLKQRIDAYADTLNSSLNEIFNQNIEEIVKHRHTLENKIKIYRSNVKKCENSLNSAGTAKIVSEKKVLEMVYESFVETSFVKPDITINSPYHDQGNTEITDKLMLALFGQIKKCTQSLDDLCNQSSRVTAFECPSQNVNAIACKADGDTTWVCLNGYGELINFNEMGVRLNAIQTDFKIDDITIADNTTIFATSSDSYCLKSIKLDSKDRIICSKIIESDLFLHGITLSADGTKVAVCGTDTPNYTDKKPTETTIIEYSLKGEEIKRVSISGYAGKVYRIAQNRNYDYVVTFPKEGRVLSVTCTGEIRASFGELYNASGEKHELDKTEFWPSGVCCDKDSNILVSDWLGKRVLVLDMNCSFLKYFGGYYISPNAVVVNRNTDRLWIGDKGYIEVWKL